MILTLLKERTANLHEQIERTMDISVRVRSLERYAALLERFLGFYEPLETRIADIGEFPFHIDFNVRRKTGWLRTDLSRLGYPADRVDSLPRCEQLPAVFGTPDALGCLYVLEGATLGGQFVRREIAVNLGLNPERGCAFFTSYGDRVGAMWKEFCAGLNEHAAGRPDETDRIVTAAIGTFVCLNRWIAEDA